MKRSTQILRSLILLMFTAVVFTSCVKKEYDDIATANVDPAITATHTIKQFQAMANGAVPKLIDTDVIIAGIVVGDDASGNIYVADADSKYIQKFDSEGNFLMKFGGSSTFTTISGIAVDPEGECLCDGFML